jgi:anaerobic selenocysteine-containing dehydrogenase
MINLSSLSRRTFLKGVGSVSAAAGLMGLIPGTAQAVESIGANPVLLNKRAGKRVYHSCLRNCADRCLLRFSVQNGRMTWVEGADEQYKTGTCPCVKGLTYVQYTYAPDRILHPMVRIGPKGSHKWRRISWEEAWKILVDKTKETISKYGAEAILPYSYSGNYGMIGMRGMDRFFNKLGASYLDRLVCIAAGAVGCKMTQGTTEGPDPELIPTADAYISWGWNETCSNIHVLKYVNELRDRGGKVISVNPNRTPLSSQADIWLQPKPSTDAWVCVGAIKYLIEHDMVNWDYLNQNCMGVEECLDYCKSISWEDIVKTTGLEKKEIEEFADLLGHCKNVIMRGGLGMNRNYNGARMARAYSILFAVRGFFGRPNTGIIYSNARLLLGLNGNKGRGDYMIGKVQHVNMTSLDTALLPDKPWTDLDKKPIKPIHMLVIYNGNPMSVSPNTNLLEKNLKRDDLFVVGFDMIMTDSMDLCDIILPASTQFETDDLIADYGAWYLQVCNKVIEPLGESMPNWDFFAEWGRRMGFTDQEFKDTSIDCIKQWMTTDAPYYKGVTYELLQEKKFLHIDLPVSVPNYGEGKINTPSGKIELYSEQMKKLGYHPVIDLGLPEDEMPEEERKLPFRMLSPAIPQRVNSEFYNVKYMRAFNAYECEINPQDAQKLGINAGDRVKLSNQRGHAFFIARVTTRVKPGVVRTAKNNWRRMNPYGIGTSTNCLTTSRLTDLGGCSAYHSTRVNVEKA